MRDLHNRVLLALVLLLSLVACVDPVKAPSGLSYATNPASYTVGVAIKDNAPTLAVGGGIAYSVSPALPAGLALDAGTGVLSGTPTVVTAQATYTITAKNSAGSTSVALLLAVVEEAPAGLTYAVNPATYTAGQGIASNAPSSTGGTPTNYTSVPTLPAGLVLDPATGILTGTPTAVTAQADYTITAANSGGSTQATLTLTVEAPSLTFTEVPAATAVLVGQTARFAVAAAGTGTLTYQWARNGTALPGATGTTLLTPATVIGDNGAVYTVTVSDTYGSQLTSPGATLTVSATPPGRTSATGSLLHARRAHTATLLANGKVLVVGGFDNTSLATAELYDPATYTFTATGSLTTARSGHTATLLQDGRVLIAGGQSFGAATTSAELYDPATGTFTATGNLGTARTFHTATLLGNSKPFHLMRIDPVSYEGLNASRTRR